jgi:hypothetical protein
MEEIEWLHWAGGFILGAGTYQYSRGKDQKASLGGYMIAGILGFIVIEFVLHGVLAG